MFASSRVVPTELDPPDDPRTELLDRCEQLEAERSRLIKVDSARSAAEQTLSALDEELGGIEEMERQAWRSWIEIADGPLLSTHTVEREDITHGRVPAASYLG
jgi:hypothetical protein